MEEADGHELIDNEEYDAFRDWCDWRDGESAMERERGRERDGERARQRARRRESAAESASGRACRRTPPRCSASRTSAAGEVASSARRQSEPEAAMLIERTATSERAR